MQAALAHLRRGWHPAMRNNGTCGRRTRERDAPQSISCPDRSIGQTKHATQPSRALQHNKRNRKAEKLLDRQIRLCCESRDFASLSALYRSRAAHWWSIHSANPLASRDRSARHGRAFHSHP
jgi:hypothetical protein